MFSKGGAAERTSPSANLHFWGVAGAARTENQGCGPESDAAVGKISMLDPPSSGEVTKVPTSGLPLVECPD